MPGSRDDRFMEANNSKGIYEDFSDGEITYPEGPPVSNDDTYAARTARTLLIMTKSLPV